MDIDYQDLVLLNTRLREEDIRYRVTYKNPTTACLEPPGACCCTPERQEGAYRVIRDYYQSKGTLRSVDNQPTIEATTAVILEALES